MMKKTKFQGVGTALITPFNAKGEVDYPALEKLVELQVNNGIDYLVVQGTTGESVTLTEKEKEEVLAFILKVNNNRLPVVLGVGGNYTDQIVARLKKLKPEGLSAILSVSPYYNKPTQEGIFQHYKALSEASPLPIILYNVPGRTASNLLPATAVKLAKSFPNIVGIKEASGNLEQIMSIIRLRPEGFLVISGDDNLTLPIIACGGDGVISVVSNAFPNEFSFMVHQAMDGNYGQARSFHYKLFELTQQLFVDGNPAGVKEAMQFRGICGNTVRLPLVPVTHETSSRIKFFIKENKLLPKI
jgi:4-hydroxy-tetrahydrodipicolinate synthase